MTDSPEWVTGGDEFVTIAEAARLLSIAPRQARRYAGRIMSGDRQAATEAEPLRVRLSAIAALRQATEAKKAEDKAEDIGGTQAGTGGEDSPRDMAGVMSLAYERVIEGKDAQIAQLSAALDHEREMSKRLAEALSREQTLRALSAPAEKNEKSENEPEAEPKRPWWQWRRSPAPKPTDPPSG